MKYLAILIALLFASPSLAFHGFNARQIRQGQRAQQRQNFKLQQLNNHHHVQQQLIAVPVYQQQFIAPQQFNRCQPGTLQLNSGCSALYR